MSAGEADGQVGAGAAEPDRVEALRVQRARSRLEHLDVLSPRRDGVGLVEAHGRGDGLPQPVDVGLAEHRLRPALVRAADDRPRDRGLAEQLEVARAERHHPRLGDALLVEVGEEVGLGVADEHQDRALALGQVVEPRDEPRRRPLERLLRAVLDLRALGRAGR